MLLGTMTHIPTSPKEVIANPLPNHLLLAVSFLLCYVTKSLKEAEADLTRVQYNKTWCVDYFLNDNIVDMGIVNNLLIYE